MTRRAVPGMNPLLTPGMERVLRLMREGGHSGDAELVCEGRDAWVGFVKTSRAVERELLGLCLIHDETINQDRVKRYILNEDGRAILDDPTYVPRILRDKDGRLAALGWIRSKSVLRAIQALPAPRGRRSGR